MIYRVLIAEDEDVIRRGLALSVDWQSLDCAEPLLAEDGRAAVSLIREHRPNLVLLDINMPLCSGLDVLEATYEEMSYVPIIISGYADFEYAQTAMRYGVNHYLLKPVDLRQLEEAIQSAQREQHRLLRLQELEGQTDALRKTDLLEQLAGKRDYSYATREMLRYTQNHYAEKITLHSLAGHLNYSESFLIRKFKEETGLGFNDYLNRVRIQRAIALLLAGNNQVQEVADRCGFNGYKYFRIVFRKYLGCSPSEFLSKVK